MACTRLSCVMCACKQQTLLPDLAHRFLQTRGKTSVGVRTTTFCSFPEVHISMFIKKNTDITNIILHQWELRKNISNNCSSSNILLKVGNSRLPNAKLAQCDKKATLCMNMTTNNDRHSTDMTNTQQVPSQAAPCRSDNNLHVSGDLLINNIRQEGHRNRRRFVRKPTRGIDPRSDVVIDVLYGISPCLLALQGKRRKVHKVYVSPSFMKSTRPEVCQIIDKIKEKGLNDVVEEIQHTSLDKITSGRPHQGICLETSRIYFQTLSKDSTEPEETQVQPIHLVLDQIKDPMNLGAILRSAYYLGVDRVIASRHNCCSLTPVVSKASSGVMEIMPVYATSDVLAFLKKQQESGWEIVGSTSDSSHKASTHGSKITAAEDFTLCRPTTLVIGSEGSGLSDGIEDVCSLLLTIPAGRILHSGIDSLNVSVATGILLQSLLQGRR